MNRREALKARGAMAAGVFVQPSKSGDRNLAEEREAALQEASLWARRMSRAVDEASDLCVDVAYWREQYEQAIELCHGFRDECRKLQAEHDDVTTICANLQAEHDSLLRQQWGATFWNEEGTFAVQLTLYPSHVDACLHYDGEWHEPVRICRVPPSVVHFYQGDWHTEDEWLAHLVEQETGNLSLEIDGERTNVSRTIWAVGDQFTDGTTTGTLAEVLDAG